MKLLNIIKNNPFTFILALIALIVSVITITTEEHKLIGLIEMGCVLFVALIAVRWYLNDQKRKVEQVRTLSAALRLSKEDEAAMNVFPLPVALVNREGDLIWFNGLFETLLPDLSKISNNNVSAVFSLHSFLNDMDGAVSFEAEGDKRKYTVYPAALPDDTFALYIVDDTSLKIIRKKYELSRPVVLLVNVDSLEQAEDIMPHEDYYAMNSDIDRIVTKWFVDNKCIFRKFTDGRFFAITEYEKLEEMMKKRFGVIDKVRSGHFGPSETEITLSIGVGYAEDVSSAEDDAREALDMARGRGGDQVAVKNGDNYDFFGGISGGKEKRGKVKSRVFAAALDEYIQNSSNVLIMGHSYSDFDCIGAAGGVVAIARAKGKNAHVIVRRDKSMALPLIQMLETGTGAISFISPEKALDEIHDNTLLIIVDTMRKVIVEEPRFLELGMKTVVIDHHRMAVDHIEGNTYELLEPHASSACEMITELVQYSPSKPKLTANQAQGLLAGILLDTKDFTLRVGSRTFDAASYLRSCKADTVAVRQLFSGSADINMKINETVNAAKFFNRYAIAVSGVSGGDARLVCSRAADELLKIKNVDASFVISAMEDNTLNISARSLERINVQLIMEKLGGGGHHSMAAAQLKDMTAEEAFAVLKEKIDEYLLQTKE